VRIYPGLRPTGQKNLPALVYAVIAGEPLVNLDAGDSIDTVAGDVDNVRLQLDVYAKDARRRARRGAARPGGARRGNVFHSLDAPRAPKRHRSGDSRASRDPGLLRLAFPSITTRTTSCAS
jgi:hypothetical protein